MLRALRAELSLHSGPADADGAPTWTIRDPVRNRFFRVGWPVFEIMCRWHAGSPAAIAEAVNRETTLRLSEDDVASVAGFLVANQLTRPESPQDTRRLATRAAAEQHTWIHWLLHHYLFFRLPLVRPDRWLERMLPYARWLGSGWFGAATIAALGAGLVLAGRQWDLFVDTLVDTFTVPGIVSYAVALSAVKVVHELAHALVAKRHGCRVPTMGVAFLVLWPMLYTDVNETWTLPERRKRLQVGAAGILAELAVAAWATLAWAFLPEGPLRQGTFVLAALTWVSSLAINLSPFMRFDGYFIAMDALEFPNLHPRSFAMGKWWLREALFGLGAPPPEVMPAAHRRALVAFAVAVWFYRLALFLGIAVLVYHVFIKAVGVVLFAVEIGWFVILPVWRELREWKTLQQTIWAGRRIRWSLGAFGGLFLLVLIPWQTTVTAPAVLKAARAAELYLPFPARLQMVHVRHGQSVTAGQAVMTFTAPDLDLRRVVVAARIAGREAELEAAQLDPFLRDRVGVVQEDLLKAHAEYAALEAERARLTVTASMDGRVVDILPGIQPGDWLSPHQRLGLVVGDGPPVAVAYVAEDGLDRFGGGAAARFTPRLLEAPSRDGTVARVDPSPAKTLPDGALASVHGGPIPARVSGRDLVPDGAVIRVTVGLDGAFADGETTGTITITGNRSSLIGRLARSILVVLVREWGV